MVDVEEMLNGFAIVRSLASSLQHFIPGHNPLVRQRYPKPLAGVDDVFRLDASPAAG